MDKLHNYVLNTLRPGKASLSNFVCANNIYCEIVDLTFGVTCSSIIESDNLKKIIC